MINLDQVRTLEWKVKQAVQLIVHLRRENDTLRSRLSDTEVRLQDLDAVLESFKATQNEMESGIRSALEELDNLESGDAPQVTGPVDSLPYPPSEAAPEGPFAAEDPAALFEKVSPPEVVASEPVSSEATAEPSFDEEYAALAAAEAEALASMEPAPESIELEESPVPAQDESQFFETAPEPEPEPEEKQPEQPGLGIF